MKVCSVCGATENETKIYTNLCRKHYLQVSRHGTILERTIYDKNPIEVVDDIAYMHCFDKKGNETGCVIFNAWHVDRVSMYKWYLRNSNRSSSLYAMGSISPNKKVFLHRFLVNVPKGLYIDHIDHNTLNNLDSNLRVCTSKENSRNRNNSNRVYPGVFQQYKTSDKWSAVITVDYKNIWLGTFDTLEEAINARKDAEQKYFGDFVYTGHKK